MKFNRLIRSFLAASVALSVGGTFAPAINAQEVEQVINIATNSEIATLDSAKYDDTTSSDTIGQIMEGLYRVTSGSEVELGQAESVEVSEDELTYTFKLREGIQWSNGDPVKASDFVYAYRRLVDPAFGVTSSSAQLFLNANDIMDGEKQPEELGVTALSDTELEIKLAFPAAYLPKLLSGTAFMPINEKVATELGDQYGTSSDNIVNNGPFSIEGWEGTNTEWSLVKNKDYWDAANVQLEKANVQVVKEEGTGVNLFDAGELDYLTISSDYVEEFEGTDELHNQLKATKGYLSFNTLRDVTGNAQVRRAIALAIDKQTYVDSVVKDGSIALNSSVTSGFDTTVNSKDYTEDSGEYLTYDVAAAQEEWEQAKEALGQDNVTIELLINDTTLAKRTAEYIQAQLQENLPGLTINISSMPLKNRLQKQRASEFDMFYGTWAPDYADAINFLVQYTTEGGTNFAKYSNAQYDELINAALNQTGDERRNSLISAEKIGLGEDAVEVPLYQAAASYLLNTRIEGLEVLTFGRTLNLRTAHVVE